MARYRFGGTGVSRALITGIAWLTFTAGGFAQVDLGTEPSHFTRIVWKRPTPEVDQAFAQGLQSLVLSDQSSPSLLHEESLWVVDPRMWTWLRREPDLADLDLVPTHVGLPRVSGSLSCEARCFRGEQSARWLLGHLRARFGGTPDKVVLRYPNSEEMDYVWALIPFDIEGPVLTLETPERRLVVMSLMDNALVHFYEMPSEPMGIEATLDSLAALPLTSKEASPMRDRLDDRDLELPGAIDSDDIVGMMLTEGEMLGPRISKQDLSDYLQRIDDAITEAVPKDAGRVLVQVSLDAKASPTIYLRTPPKAPSDLKARLAALKAPFCRGPVTFVAVKDR